jgi:hypothetical protein
VLKLKNVSVTSSSMFNYVSKAPGELRIAVGKLHVLEKTFAGPCDCRTPVTSNSMRFREISENS